VSHESPASSATSSGYTERECYESLLDVEAMLGKCIKDATKRKAKKVVADSAGSIFKSAGDVVKYATNKGWVL
jgi:serine/threonine-protein kinase haspin